MDELSLPEEIIQLILKAISHPPTAALCARVCTRWRMANDKAAYWRDLYYESILPKKFELAGDLPPDHRLNTPFWKQRVALTYSIQKSIKQRKCFPRILAATTIDSDLNYYHPRVQSCNKTHCAITWEIERPMRMSTDNEYTTQLINIATKRIQETYEDAAILLGDYLIFSNVTPYRTADLSSLSSVKFNAQSFDLNKPRPDKLDIPDALKMAQNVYNPSKYLVLASVHEDQELWTVHVMDLDARKIIFSEDYKGGHPSLVAHGTKFVFFSSNGVTVVDFISKQKIFTTNIRPKDALLFENTLILLDKKKAVVEIDLTTRKRQRYDIQINASKIFFYQGMFVLQADYALYFYTTTLEQISRFNMPKNDVASVVTLANGNMALTFEDDGTIYNVSFNPKDTERLVQVDLVDPQGNIKTYGCKSSDLLDNFRKVNQRNNESDHNGVTSLYFHRTENDKKRYGLLKSLFNKEETALHESNKVAAKLKVHSLNAFKNVERAYQVPFRNIGFDSETSARQYGINLPKMFEGTIAIFCEELIDGEWVFVKPDTNEWQALLKE